MPPAKHSIKLTLAPDPDLLLIYSTQRKKKMQPSSFKDISGAWVREMALGGFFFFLTWTFTTKRKKRCCLISLRMWSCLYLVYFPHIRSPLFSGSSHLNKRLTDEGSACNAPSCRMQCREKMKKSTLVIFMTCLPVLRCPNREIAVVAHTLFSFEVSLSTSPRPPRPPCTFFQLNCFS